MNGFSIFMFLFGFGILLAGFYTYGGHKSELLLWRRTYSIKNISEKELKEVGKWTMISSILPFALAIFGLFLKI